MSDKRGVERSMSSLYIMRQPCRNIGILPHFLYLSRGAERCSASLFHPPY